MDGTTAQPIRGAMDWRFGIDLILVDTEEHTEDSVSHNQQMNGSVSHNLRMDQHHHNPRINPVVYERFFVYCVIKPVK